MTQFTFGHEPVARLRINGIDHSDIAATWDPRSGELHLRGDTERLQTSRTHVVEAELVDGRSVWMACSFDHARLVPHKGELRVH